eukprot:4347947-Karenia_brevis.AAC.1
MGDGRDVLHAFFYGYPNAASNPDAMQKNEELLQAMFEVGAELGNVPLLVLGDFDIGPQKSAMLQAALATG